MYRITIGYGDGEDMRDTLDIVYTCDHICGQRFLRGTMDVKPNNVAETLTLWNRPMLYTDGRDTGDYMMLSYGYVPVIETSGHEWCAFCGALLRHGIGMDSDHYRCSIEDDVCDAPYFIEP